MSHKGQLNHVEFITPTFNIFVCLSLCVCAGFRNNTQEKNSHEEEAMTASKQRGSERLAGPLLLL